MSCDEEHQGCIGEGDLVIDLLGNLHEVSKAFVRLKKDQVYTTLEDLVWQGKDWVPDAVSTLLQERTGNLVLLVR
eukprot:1380870-Alexandrium_andersonii.AAC.1